MASLTGKTFLKRVIKDICNSLDDLLVATPKDKDHALTIDNFIVYYFVQAMEFWTMYDKSE